MRACFGVLARGSTGGFVARGAPQRSGASLPTCASPAPHLPSTTPIATLLESVAHELHPGEPSAPLVKDWLEEIYKYGRLGEDVAFLRLLMHERAAWHNLRLESRVKESIVARLGGAVAGTAPNDSDLM